MQRRNHLRVQAGSLMNARGEFAEVARDAAVLLKAKRLMVVDDAMHAWRSWLALLAQSGEVSHCLGSQLQA